MNTHNHSIYQAAAPVEIGMDSIDLRQVRANDHLLFWTKRSCYRFRVTDAADLCGQLSRSGEQACNATWIGAISATDGDSHFESAEIRTGARALFVLSGEGRNQSLVTSVINRIVIIRQSAASPLQ